jgi:hypothetical protein
MAANSAPGVFAIASAWQRPQAPKPINPNRTGEPAINKLHGRRLVRQERAPGTRDRAQAATARHDKPAFSAGQPISVCFHTVRQMGLKHEEKRGGIEQKAAKDAKKDKERRKKTYIFPHTSSSLRPLRPSVQFLFLLSCFPRFGKTVQVIDACAM